VHDAIAYAPYVSFLCWLRIATGREGNDDSWEVCHKIDPKKQLDAVYLVFN
jgi:hypothetical protein